MLRFASLASGSDGNALVVEADGSCLMVDCGLNLRDTERRLARLGLEVERIWERDCHGAERPWSLDRGLEDVTERKWLVVAVLRRIRST